MTVNEFVGYFKWISLDEAVQFSREAITFYIRPINFFKNVLSKNTNEKLKQLTFYYLILTIFFIILTNAADILIGRLIIIGVLAQCAIDIIPIILGLYLTNVFFKIKKDIHRDISNSIFFLTFCYAFFIPLVVIPYALYLKTQEYQFMLMFAIMACIVLVFKYIFFANVFFIRITQSLAAILITFIIANTLLILLNFIFQLDGYQSDKVNSMTDIDPVYTEFNKIIIRCNFLDDSKYPTFFSEIYENNKRYALFNFTNNFENADVFKKDFISDVILSEKMIDRYSKDSNLLNKVTDSLKFERNKVIFRKINDYYKTVIQYGLQPQDTANAVHVFGKKGSQYKFYVYMPEKIINQRRAALDDIGYIQHGNDMASKPIEWIMLAYYWPALLIESRIY